MRTAIAVANYLRYHTRDADVAELVDALGLGSSTVRCGGSSPFIRTTTDCNLPAQVCCRHVAGVAATACIIRNNEG